MEAQEKPEFFDFQITTLPGISTEFVIDRINSEVIDPLKLRKYLRMNSDGMVVTSQIKIKTLLKKFAKGINTIEIASSKDGNESLHTNY